MSRINIILDNCDGTCYAGGAVSGRLECYFAKTKKYRDITIQCVGREKTCWTEREIRAAQNNQTETHYVHYSGEHIIYASKVCLIKSGRESLEVPAGSYIYPFSFLLPATLPASYEHEYGSIKYKLKGVVDRPWRFDYDCELEIIVAATIDLNRFPDIRGAATVSNEKQVCCLCCKSGPVEVTITLPHTGFAPGETVPCAASVQNLSNVTIEGVDFRLQRLITFSVEAPKHDTKKQHDVVAKASSGRIGAHGEHNFTVDLKIPANFKVPCFNMCRLFSAKHFFTVEVHLPWPHTDLEVELPVKMGHVKLGSAPAFLPPPPPPPRRYLPPAYAASAPPAALGWAGSSGYRVPLQGHFSGAEGAAALPPPYEQVMQGASGWGASPPPFAIANLPEKE